MAPQDFLDHKGQLERRITLIHIPKTGGTSFLEQAPQHMPVGYTLKGNGERSIHQTHGEKTDMVLLLREPIQHVVSQFLMCKYSTWGRWTTKKSSFPGHWAQTEDFNYTNVFAGLDEWVQHFLNQETIQSNDVLGADAAYNCYNPWNMQTRYLSIPGNNVSNKPKADSHFVFDPHHRFPPLDVAKTHFKDIGFVGITDFFDASMCLFEFQILGYLTTNCQCTSSGLLARQANSTPIVWDVPRYSMNDLGNATRNQIKRLVKIDTAMYEHALEKFLRDLQHAQQVTGVNLKCGQLSLLSENKKEAKNAEEGREIYFAIPRITPIPTLILSVFLTLFMCSKQSRRQKHRPALLAKISCTVFLLSTTKIDYHPISTNNVIVGPEVSVATQQEAKVQAPPPFPPMVLISRGCSGSTFLMRFAIKLVKRHTGLDSYFGYHQHEYLATGKKDKNPYYNYTLAQTDPFLADKKMVLKTFQIASRESSQTMIIKTMQAHLTPGVAFGLQELSTRFVVTYRRNLLERKICSIRDCFNKNRHESVFENGTKSDLCFERRIRPEIKTLARVDKKSFSNFMTTQMRDWGCEDGRQGDSLKAHIDGVFESTNHSNTSYPMLPLESLEAFENSQEHSLEFNKSLISWGTLLRGWGIEPQQELIVEEMLLQGMGVRKHRSALENVYNRQDIEQLFDMWATDPDLCDWRWMLGAN